MHDTPAFMDMVSARRGHFRHESGYHSELWLELDGLFASAARIAPFVASLAAALGRHQAEVVCGPLLGGAFLAQLVAQALDVEFCFAERVAPAAGGFFQVRYALPAAFSRRVRGRRVAMVDDVMSAGSALRGCHAELLARGAEPVVAGALLVLGSTGADYFAARHVPLEAVVRDRYTMWLPAECPLCSAGVPLEDVTDSLAPASQP